MPGNLRYSGSGGSQNPHAMSSRTMSLDNLHDRNNSSLDQKIQEYLPKRVLRTQPKANEAAMQFVKTGPARLYKTATEQIKKTEAGKELRKTMEAEEVDWQEPYSSSSSSTRNPYDDGSDWQSNLDKWKSSRRKRNEEALERVIEIKKFEQEEELSKTRRKSKTFNEMREDKNKRGRRYNLVVHDDDNNDLSGLGLSGGAHRSAVEETKGDEIIDPDNKDAKSDAGFCTGSDTGSDGVFPDNISDTSSALGDKKEAHDSLLDTGLTKEEESHINGHTSTALITDLSHATPTQTTSSNHTDEYTYDKAIAGYKQYAENSAKRRTSSITSLNSNTSFTKEEDKKDEKLSMTSRSSSPSKGKKLEGMVNFFSQEMEKDFKTSPEPKVIMREKSPKVDVVKRRSMFETRDPSSEREQKQANRRSLDMSGSLKTRVASFENLDTDTRTTSRVRGVTPNRETNLRSKVASFEKLDTEVKYRGITPPRDTKFQDKRAAFSTLENEVQQVKKKTPERDSNFQKKLKSFVSMEEDKETMERSRTLPQGDTSLKSKIASFEQVAESQPEPRPRAEPRDGQMHYKDRSVSLENLDEPLTQVKLRPAHSMGSILRRIPSTPYMEVNLDQPPIERKCEAEVLQAVSFPPDQADRGSLGPDNKRATVFETVEKCQVVRDVESAPLYSIFQYLSPEVGEDSRGETSELHHYQTLEEVRDDIVDSVKPIPSPPSPTPPVALPSSSTTPPTKKQQPPQPNSSLFASPLLSPVSSPAEPVIPEVLDVTWTDSGPSQAAPPSEPPPPPPPDDDDSDSCDLPSLAEHQQEEREQEEDEKTKKDGFTRENSTRRLKKELYRRMSNFLGSSSHYMEEETTVKPPPDITDLLRQEREAERSMYGGYSPTQQILLESEIARKEREIIENMERSERMKQQQQQQQHQTLLLQKKQQKSQQQQEQQQQQQTFETQNLVTGEREEAVLDKGEYEEHMQYQEKLAELEEEMLRHDKDMLRRVGHLPQTSQTPLTPTPPSPHNHHPTPTPAPADPSTQSSGHQHLPIQEFYTAPSYESLPVNHSEDGYELVEEQKEISSPTSPSSSYYIASSVTSTLPFTRSSSQPSIDTPSVPHNPLQATSSSPVTGPEPLPRRKKVPLPSPTKTERSTDLNTAERREAMRVSRMSSNEPQRSDSVETQESTTTSGHQMTKQTLLALSAIPKPRLIENEGWIKKKEVQKRDYSKHWLHQEAEQRRLEQQDRISRQKYTPVVQPQSPSPTLKPKSFASTTQQTTTMSTKSTSSLHQTSQVYPPQTTTPVFSSYPQALKNPSPVLNNNTNNSMNGNNISVNNIINNNNNNNNNSWRNQATTYQPHIPTPPPTSDKALPDSIINNLTQRVNSKNKNTYNNSGGRLSSNSNSSTYSGYRDDYHDYMNTDALSSTTTSPAGPSPLYQGGGGSPSTPQPQEPPTSPQPDQRLLSVSGKKKCSHCSEELGRGAAMIIESLRLFYHIPCFKCCVCGIQLGNGSAGADVRVRNHKLHCHNCYSNDEGMKFSKV